MFCTTHKTHTVCALLFCLFCYFTLVLENAEQINTEVSNKMLIIIIYIKSNFSNYVQIDNWLNSLNIWNVKSKTKAKLTIPLSKKNIKKNKNPKDCVEKQQEKTVNREMKQNRKIKAPKI